MLGFRLGRMAAIALGGRKLRTMWLEEEVRLCRRLLVTVEYDAQPPPDLPYSTVFRHQPHTSLKPGSPDSATSSPRQTIRKPNPLQKQPQQQTRVMVSDYLVYPSCRSYPLDYWEYTTGFFSKIVLSPHCMQLPPMILSWDVSS